MGLAFFPSYSQIHFTNSQEKFKTKQKSQQKQSKVVTPIPQLNNSHTNPVYTGNDLIPDQLDCLKQKQLKKFHNLETQTRSTFQSNFKKNQINFQQKQKQQQTELHEIILGPEILQQKSKLNHQSFTVPFQVIHLLLNENLIQIIKSEQANFFIKYQNDDCSFKLFKSGFYGHILSPFFGIFINKNYFYEGHFIERFDGQILPSNKGVYLTQDGKYVGQFCQGQPHGKGRYFQFIKRRKNSRDAFQASESKVLIPPKIKFVFEGTWQNGYLIKGTAENEQTKYEGFFQNRKPHGFGKLFFKKSGISYEGYFLNGLFDGQKSRYETLDYIYQGAFKNGVKQGYGILTQNCDTSRKTHCKNQRTASKRFEGVWKNDKLKNISNKNRTIRSYPD